MTLQDRAAAFKAAYSQWPASWPHVGQEQDHDVLYAIWVLGNDYRNQTRFYGAYPPTYVERVLALFPDVAAETLRKQNGETAEWPVLHAFSGQLPRGPYLRCDLRQPADYGCSISELPAMLARIGRPLFRLVLADPPYSAADAAQYETPTVDRRRAMQALAQVVIPGGFLAWLDTCWPMHRKAEWLTVGRIPIIRSTNHRVRLLTLFQRQPSLSVERAA